MEISSSDTVSSTTWQFLFGYTSYPAFVAPSGYSVGQALNSTSDFIHRDSIDLLARMIYGEASNPQNSSPTQEQYGTANVANNRKNHGKWGSSFVAVLLFPSQFTSMEGSKPQTLNPVLTSDKWKAALSAAQNYSNNNPIGSRKGFCANSAYPPFTGCSSKLVISQTTFFDFTP